MDLLQLKIFSAVIQAGSFSKAALELEISQSAVSRAIASLEDELRVCLLARGRFGAKPTRLGEKIHLLAQQILQLREQMDAEVQENLNLIGGRVRIGSFRSAATHLLPPLLADFAQKFPRIEISLKESTPRQVIQNLRAGEVDIGFIPIHRPIDDLETWEILRDEFVVLLPEKQDDIPDVMSWEHLKDYTFILNDSECTLDVKEHWKKSGHPMKVIFQFSEDSTIVGMVNQGLGAAILPKLAAMPIPEKVCIRSLPISLERRIGAAILNQTIHPPEVLTFWNLLRAMSF